jgi:glutaredoxin 3
MSFMIYSRDGCPFCTKIKQVLQMKNYTFVEVKLGAGFTREQFYERFGAGATFPQVIYNGQKLGGCTETVRYLQEQNML